MNTQRFVPALLMALCALSVAVLAGCGADGGANSETTVTIKPSQPEESGGESGDGGGGGSDDSSSEAVEGGIGTLTGTVVFDGTAPELAPLVEQGENVKDGAVCAAEPVPNQVLVVNDGRVANVFIYLERAPKGADIPAPAEEAAVFDQKGCLFMPHAMAVQVGRELLVKSDDPIAHNTHTFPVRNNPFNSVISPDDRKGVALVYDKAEKTPIEVKCDFHNWMLAYHLPLDHPYFAVSGEDGTFKIENLPSGKHKFRIWHEKAGFLDRGYEVTINPDEETDVTLTYGAAEFAERTGPKPKQVMISSR